MDLVENDLAGGEAALGGGGGVCTTREGCAVCVCVCVSVAYFTIQIVPFALTIISLLEKNTFAETVSLQHKISVRDGTWTFVPYA